MITLNQIAEQIILLESGGSQSRDSEIQFEDVVLLVRQVAANLLKLNYFENIAAEEVRDVAHHFIYPYVVEVQNDETRKVSFITLPEVPSSLPSNKGFRSVSPKSNPFIEYAIVHSGQMAMIGSILNKNEIVAYPENNRVYFNKDIKCLNITQVLVKVVTAVPETLDANALVYIPYDFQNQIITGVRQALVYKPIDKANDANPTP